MKKVIPRIRPTWDKYFMNIVDVVATRSHDAESQVGCVIVAPDRRIISTGYNGFPPGFPDNELPNTRPEKYRFMVHAEANAIATALKDLTDSTIYLTFTPCKDCVKLLLTAGVKRIVCKEPYTDWEEVKEILRYSKITYKIGSGPDTYCHGTGV